MIHIHEESSYFYQKKNQFSSLEHSAEQKNIKLQTINSILNTSRYKQNEALIRNFKKITQNKKKPYILSFPDHFDHLIQKQDSILQSIKSWDLPRTIKTKKMNITKSDQIFLKSKKYHQYNQQYKISKYEMDPSTGFIFESKQKYFQQEKSSKFTNSTLIEEEEELSWTEDQFLIKSQKTQENSVYFNFSDIDENFCQQEDQEYTFDQCFMNRTTETGR